MAVFKAKIAGKVYTLDRLTLGDGPILQDRFGVNDLENIEGGAPKTLLGLLTLAVAKTDNISIDDALAFVSDVSFDEVETGDTVEVEAAPENPQMPDASEATVSPT